MRRVVLSIICVFAGARYVSCPSAHGCAECTCPHLLGRACAPCPQVAHNTTSTSANPVNWRTAGAIAQWWEKNPPTGGLTKKPTFWMIKSPQLFQLMWFFRCAARVRAHAYARHSPD